MSCGPTRQDPLQLRGEERYLHLVEPVPEPGRVTPEDPYRIWDRARAAR